MDVVSDTAKSTHISTSKGTGSQHPGSGETSKRPSKQSKHQVRSAKSSAGPVAGASASNSSKSASHQAVGGTTRNAKKNRRKKEAHTAADEHVTAAGATEDPIGKVKLKVVVRRLPPNVPEAVFWKAVSPWITRRQHSSSTDSVKKEGGTEHKVDAQAGTGTGTEEEPKANVDFSYFVQGKLKDGNRRGISNPATATPHVFSRAYVHFTSVEALVSFHRGFDGHLFKDSKGNEYVAVVEFAPFQRMSHDLSKRKKPDARQGTIDDDPDYKAFLTSLEEKKPTNESETQAEKTDAQLMSHLTSSQAKTTIHAEKAKHTPLLDHLRAKHTARAESTALKNARSYLNRNNTAYAAASTKSSTGADKKGKGKTKAANAPAAATASAQGEGAGVKSKAGKEPSIPIGPKASKKSESRGGKKGPQLSGKADTHPATPAKGSSAAGQKGASRPQVAANTVEGSQAKSAGTMSILTKSNGEQVLQTPSGVPTGSEPARGGGGGGGGAGRGGRGRGKSSRGGAGRGRGTAVSGAGT